MLGGGHSPHTLSSGRGNAAYPQGSGVGGGAGTGVGEPLQHLGVRDALAAHGQFAEQMQGQGLGQGLGGVDPLQFRDEAIPDTGMAFLDRRPLPPMASIGTLGSLPPPPSGPQTMALGRLYDQGQGQ
ncbi:unnamed protein product, partial [Discosporangium mesarthrocarpum]